MLNFNFTFDPVCALSSDHKLTRSRGRIKELRAHIEELQATLELGQNNGLEETKGAPGIAALAGVLPETKLKRIGFKGIDYLEKTAFDALCQAARSCGVELDEDSWYDSSGKWQS